MGNPFGRSTIVPLTNKSGGSVAAGDFVYIDTANNDSFTTGTTGAYTKGIGIAQQTIASNAIGLVLIDGYASLVNVNASVTRGNFLKSYTVVKQGTDAGASRISGTCGMFLTGGTTPDALIWQPDLGGGSGGNASATSIAPSSDTYINDQSATTNNDAATTLTVGNKWGTASFTRFALLTFDTSSLAGKTIVAAHLFLVQTNSTPETAVATRLEVRRLLRAYSPTQATWNVYSTGNNWTTAGAESAGNDISATTHGGVIVQNSGLVNNSYELPMQGVMQESLDNSETTLRIAIGMSNVDGSGNAITVASLENTTAAYRPKLFVVYI